MWSGLDTFSTTVMCAYCFALSASFLHTSAISRKMVR